MVKRAIKFWRRYCKTESTENLMKLRRQLRRYVKKGRKGEKPILRIVESELKRRGRLKRAGVRRSKRVSILGLFNF
ncbi:MAG: hypothetical protein QXL54_03170 [Candidatus Bathyarchaeia archaeon]